MDKKLAIELLGGTVTLAAKAIGINAQAISQWPDVLPPRIADRVQAALWRKHVGANTEGQRAAEKAEA
jgi:transcriptional repressor of cell division inhibition gene dicB